MNTLIINLYISFYGVEGLAKGFQHDTIIGVRVSFLSPSLFFLLKEEKREKEKWSEISAYY